MTDKQEIISIVIPCYNGEKTIGNTLRSLYKQTDKDFEVVIINDGSEDDSETIIKRWNKHLNITYWKQQNKGLGYSRNIGINISKGKYICFLDADDIWCSNKVEVIKEVIYKENHRDMIISHHEYIATKELDIRGYIAHKVPKKWRYLVKYGNTMSPSAVCISKRILTEVGGFSTDKDIHGVEDWELWIRILKQRPRVVNIDTPLGLYIIHDKNMIHEVGFREKAIRVVEKHMIECTQFDKPKQAEQYAMNCIYEARSVKTMLNIITKHTQSLSLRNKGLYLTNVIRQISIRVLRKIINNYYRMRYFVPNELKTSIRASFENSKDEKQLTNSSLWRSEG